MHTRKAIAIATFCIATLAIVPAVGVAQQPLISVSNVTVTPSQPTPGETVTIDATITNQQSSSSVFVINGIALIRGTDQPSRVEDVGSLSPGSSVTIPQTIRFENEGVKRFKVRVWGRNQDSGKIASINYPVTVTVADQHPRIDVDVNESVVGTSADGTITVANGLDSAVKNVELTVRGDGVTITNARDVFATIDSGATKTANFELVPKSGGKHTVTVTMEYTTAGGTVRNVSEQTTVRSESIADDVVLKTSRSSDGTAVGVTVENRGNARIENVVVHGRGPNATFQSGFVDAIDGGESARVRLNATLDGNRSPVTVEATYDVADGRGSATAQTHVVSPPTTVDLTGLDVTRENGKYHVSGSTSNLGTTEADSVVVSVVDTASVDPAYPNREYFVGTIPASDFVSFDVYASVSGNATSIPLRVSYLVDGERRQRTTRVPLPATDDAGADANSNRGTGLLLPVAIGGLVVIVVGAIIVLAWRNSRGGD